MATTQEGSSNTRSPKRGKAGKPAAVVRFGSAAVPVYKCGSGGRVRFAISHYRDGRRLRQFFTSLAAAKKEALFVAQRIQSGMQHVTDLKPHERDNYAKAVELLGGLGLPLVAAVEDYVQARKLAESESLISMATDYRRVFKPLTPGALALDVDLTKYLRRHHCGDWGEELCAEDKQANEDALVHGTRLLSCYRTTGGARLYIITEHDRSISTILLPEEY